MLPTELLQKMQDIEGLDRIGCWPLAVGWWLITGIIILLMAGIVFFYVRRKKYKNSWSYSTHEHLIALEKSITTKSKKYIITELSESLRQIAIKKYPREACASISGQEWLVWLKAHDKKQFDWVQYGEILVLGPYAPNLQNINNADLKMLINAAKRWVK